MENVKIPIKFSTAGYKFLRNGELTVAGGIISIVDENGSVLLRQNAPQVRYAYVAPLIILKRPEGGQLMVRWASQNHYKQGATAALGTGASLLAQGRSGPAGLALATNMETQAADTEIALQAIHNSGAQMDMSLADDYNRQNPIMFLINFSASLLLIPFVLLFDITAVATLGAPLYAIIIGKFTSIGLAGLVTWTSICLSVVFYAWVRRVVVAIMLHGLRIYNYEKFLKKMNLDAKEAKRKTIRYLATVFYISLFLNFLILGLRILVSL